MARPQTKSLSYLVSPGVTLEDFASAWRGFAWESGKHRCILTGPWGCLQVWAASEAEGRRVCLHALAAGGWMDRAGEGQWSAREVAGGRWRNPRTWTTAEGDGLIGVSMREGPGGPPNYPDS